MKGIAVYAGSFDPVTLGHTDLIERAKKMFDHLIVAIGVNSSKKPVFSLAERIFLLKATCPGIDVVSFEGLLSTFCTQQGATVIVRGLRAAGDFEYELGIAHANRTQNTDIDTVFMPTKPEFSFVSSSTVKEIARHNGNVLQFVAPVVAEVLRRKFNP